MSNISRAFERIESHVKKISSDHLQAFALELKHRVMARTPVDTGLARKSWSGPIRIDAKTVMVANPVYYTVFLEHGWSKQAPQGMVRRTITEMTG